MAKIPCEYSGGGTILSNSGNVSAYASPSSSVTVTSLTLTKGVWLVIGHLDLNVNYGTGAMQAVLSSNGLTVRTTGTGGGGVYVEDIVDVASSMTVTLGSYQYSDTILSGKLLRGHIKAYKLSD